MKRLTHEREKKGWSKNELARQAQLNPSTVSLIEAGRMQPYPVQLAKLLCALDLPAGDADLLLLEVDDDE
jgi:transcriptional regulator with XRE-family HTH domain